MFSLLKFLGLEPFNDKRVWDEKISRAIRFNDEVAEQRLQVCPARSLFLLLHGRWACSQIPIYLDLDESRNTTTNKASKDKKSTHPNSPAENRKDHLARTGSSRKSVIWQSSSERCWFLSADATYRSSYEKLCALIGNSLENEASCYTYWPCEGRRSQAWWVNLKFPVDAGCIV